MKRKSAERRQPLVSYTSPNDIPGTMSESETLLDSSLASDFQPPQPSSYVRDTSMGSINTQSTTLTCNSKIMSPAVTVVDIDFNQKRLKRRKSFDGITDELGGKGSVLRAIESNQNIVRDTLDRQTSGEIYSNFHCYLYINPWKLQDLFNYL